MYKCKGEGNAYEELCLKNLECLFLCGKNKHIEHVIMEISCHR